MNIHPPQYSRPAPRVGLFVTCLVDLLRPSVGFAAVQLLEQTGCQVEVPGAQTCCGQPAYNNGDRETARALARRTIEICAGFDAIVLPSGSCAGMLKVHYPRLFADDPAWHQKALEFAGRCHELTSFLYDARGGRNVPATFRGTVTCHDSCSSLRELGIRQQPRALLAGVAGLTLVELADSETCCGFGGTFCVKYPDISARLVSDKAAAVQASGADIIAGGDLGCLMNIAGRLQRLGSPVRAFHVAELLAGMTDASAIGEGTPRP